MDPREVSAIARKGLDARNRGHYDEAERHFRKALQHSDNPVQQADIMLNLADAIRRNPEGIDDARQVLHRARQKVHVAVRESLEAEKIHAAVIHHLARLERQAGNIENAALMLGLAMTLLGKYLTKTRWRKPLPIDVVMMRLDMASVLALDNHPEQARSYARRALVWMLYPRFWSELSKAHFGRAAILFIWAGSPEKPNFGWKWFPLRLEKQLQPYIQRAFFGRTAGD